MHALLEVTSSEAALTGMKSCDRKSRHYRKYVPRRITHFRSYDVTSCDVTFGQVTSGSHATFGQEQWYILYYHYSRKKVGMHSPPLLTEGYTSPSPQLQQYLQSNEEEPYYILKTNNPFFLGFQTDTIPHPWSTIQHLEQLRSHPKGNHPLSIL
jgi:hypothetical protein